MAKEYIDRVALAEAICEDFEPISFAMLFRHLNDAPIADVVEVVRCDDCERRYENDNGEYVCSYTECLCADDDFCSYGVRRDNDETD